MGLFDRFLPATPTAGEDKSKVAAAEEGATRLIEEGQLLEAQGRVDEALQNYLEAIRQAPNMARAHLNHGNALLAKGDLQGALEAFRTAIKYKPDYAGAYYNMGNALLVNGRLGEAEESYRKALEIKPDYAEVHCSLGIALKELGRLDDAISSYRRALEIKPDLLEARSNLGVIIGQVFNTGIALLNNGKLEAAVESFRQVLKIEPKLAEAHFHLGNTLKKLGQNENAIASYRRALEIKPDYSDAYCNLGIALQDSGRLEDAVANYRRALKIKPDYAEAHYDLGTALKDLGQLDGAVASYHHALEIKPDLIEAHNNLGIALQDMGRIEAAAESFRHALKIDPEFFDAYSNLLFALNNTGGVPPSNYLEQARRYGKVVAGKAKRFTGWQCDPHPERLRVGLVSGDLRVHSVGHFLEGLLSYIDPARIELIAYPTHQKEDELSARIRPFFSAWKSLVGKSDEAAAHLIHGDGVHVLLDTSGHTAHNRLPVFAWKPAPVQVTWLGLPNTTGVSEMDYILGDLQAIPPEHEGHFTETVWRMPDSYVCFTAPKYPVSVSPLPALATGYVTFGSFNNLTKMNDAVVELWSRILLSVPGSRLYLKTSQLKDAGIREQTRQRFAARGIAAERLLLGGTLGLVAEHLAEYNKLDIALDTFPYPGVTTSVEALWMGVPVLSLQGDRFLSLSAKSIAHYAGLSGWVAADKDDYAAKAVAFASDLNRLSALRAGLRQQVLASPLFDTKRFARNFENALWGMWRVYHDQQEKSA